MYFDLTDEQQAIKSTAHDFLASRFKSERIREIAESEGGFDGNGWGEMAELGWAGLALPEEWGGQGLGIVEQLATYTSEHPCCQPRVTNIHRIADIIDGYVLKPGEQFDLNAVVGRRDTARGFERRGRLVGVGGDPPER